MSLESIIEHILNEAETQKESILRQAQQERDSLLQQANQEAERLYGEILEKEKNLCQKEKQRMLVEARLENKKRLLKNKQELIDTAFIKLKSVLKKDRFKKQQIFHGRTSEVSEDIDFYLNKIRPDYETEVARILFS